MNQEITQLGLSARHFGVLLSPTPRGARLARRLTTAHLLAWDMPPRTIEAAEQITAELATNAATHGRLSGRDFLLELRRTGKEGGDALRIEVTDTRGDRLPGLSPNSRLRTPSRAEGCCWSRCWRTDGG